MKLIRKQTTFLLILFLVLIFYLNYNREPEFAPLYDYRVVNKYPHDPDAFTQGLLIHRGVIYEGTGLYGSSSLRITNLETGEVIQSISLPNEYFGEGITIHKQQIYQLTWRQQIGFIYDLNLEKVSNFTIQGEGWGITSDGVNLIVSNGTSLLNIIDPETMCTINTITVTFNDEEIIHINELEYIKGYIYANIWQTNRVAIIDLENGEVISWIDLTDLQSNLDYTQGIDVLNGIAYNYETNKLYVTGKLWPNLFEIEMIK